MDYDLDEYLEEYDEFTQNVSRADINSFINRLDQWLYLLDTGEESVRLHIKWLENKTEWTTIKSNLLGNVHGRSRSEALELPLDKYERLSTQLHIFRKISSGELRLYNLLRDYYLTGSNQNLNTTLNSMIDTLFEPFSKELRRFIIRIFDTEVPDELDQNPSAQIPASDRIVTINHNDPQYDEVRDLLQSIESDIRGINDVEPDLKDRALAELRAANEILKAQSARFEVLKTLLFDGLKWLAIKFADHAVGIAVLRILTLVGTFLGIM